MKYRITVWAAAAVLLLSLAAFLVPSFRNQESSENRTMATFHMVFHPDPGSVVYRESPVERLEAALSDQFPFRSKLVTAYLKILNTAEDASFKLAWQMTPHEADQHYLKPVGKYVEIEDTGYITTRPSTNPMEEDKLKRKARQLETLHQRFPDLRFYTYFVSQAYDTTWFDSYLGTKTADHYQNLVDAMPEFVRCARLEYLNLQDYMDKHYKTDHHWNHRGARQGYEDLYNLMSQDFEMGEMLVPLSENMVSKTYDFVYKGSYGRNLGDLFSGDCDEFGFYEYDFPEETYAILKPKSMKESKAVTMGLYEQYRQGEIKKAVGTDHYVKLYKTAVTSKGKTYGEEYPYIIRNSEGNGRNLLIVSDSYGRALRDPLAAHFDTTIYVDYRILKKVYLDTVIEKYQIDTLLICSNKNIWNSGGYNFRFREEEKE